MKLYLEREEMRFCRVRRRRGRGEGMGGGGMREKIKKREKKKEECINRTDASSRSSRESDLHAEKIHA